MSTKPIAGRVRKTYEFIKAHRHEFSVQMMCRLLEVAPSGYYEWLKQPISNRAKRRRWAELLRMVFRVEVAVCPRCGGEFGFVTEPPVVRRILAHLERRAVEARAGPWAGGAVVG